MRGGSDLFEAAPLPPDWPENNIESFNNSNYINTITINNDRKGTQCGQKCTKLPKMFWNKQSRVIQCNITARRSLETFKSCSND